MPSSNKSLVRGLWDCEQQAFITKTNQIDAFWPEQTLQVSDPVFSKVLESCFGEENTEGATNRYISRSLDYEYLLFYI